MHTMLPLQNFTCIPAVRLRMLVLSRINPCRYDNADER